MKSNISKISKPSSIIMILLLAGLTGCDLIGGMVEFGCLFSSDSSHCYQSAAVQQSNPDLCEKIEGKGFSGGSNPPRDKCYLMIAQNTGDYEICSKIKGGPASYTKEECVTEIAGEKVDPKGCTYLSGTAKENCLSSLSDKITPDKVKSLDDEIESIKDILDDDPNNAAAKKKLSELTASKNQLIDLMGAANKQQYTKEKVDDIMVGINDEDVASEIRKEFIKYKSQNKDANFDQLMDKLAQIKEEKEFVKRLDDQANELVDNLKGSITDYADEKKQEAIDALKEKGWSWMKSQGGDQLYWHMKKLEDMRDKYDKYSAKYAELNEKMNKIKGVYDEVSAVYKKVDKFNRMVAEGKINEGQAKVLKGAVLLGRGLEYATGYIPVFGSTASKISKETFEATVKLATKRAERTNAINKCIDDPDNCDTDAISAY